MKERLRRANEGLPTVRIKGKDYVMVKDRVAAFRREFPEWGIVTNIEKMESGECVISARVVDDEMRVVATGLAHEKETASAINRTSYVENCETSAIGRALACIGIGIDDSYGSADEVATAINRQDLSKSEVRNLVDLVMHSCNVDKFGAIERIQFITGKSSSEDLTPEDYAKVAKEVSHE